MMHSDYKAQKEAFVSNLTGSPIGDIASVSLIMSLSVLVWSVCQSRLRLFTPYTPVAYLIDFLLNCVAFLFATTIYSSSPSLLNLFLLLPAVTIYLKSSPISHKHTTRAPIQSKTVKSTPLDSLPIKPSITHYRGAMIVSTCVAILAVDFPIFPRRFAKVENWGTSLMDLGVGSFVFSSGVVSVRSSLKDQVNKTHQRLSQRLSQRLLGSVRHSIPLLALGLIRLFSVKGLDYAEHVTEYGVHWNFFFTLGLLPPFVALLQSAFDVVRSYAILACILGASYELLLDRTNLGAFILVAPRTNLLSMNREGIFSFIGYLAIFLAGQSVGMTVLPRQQPARKGASKNEVLRNSILARLIILAGIWSLLYTFSTSYYGLGLTVSRRLANLPYFLLVTSFNCAQIAFCYAIERFCFPDIYKSSTKEEEARRCKGATSSILHAYNRNGLAIFLLANLLTGLVNMTMPTLHMRMLESMGVLIGYISVLSVVAVVLDRRNISIKL
ncbi:GPI-anchored wall transfer protein 1 [Delitschia confertaspora ATCC 74209]|uniref:GPI-anchored wall transfer protein n=1 Tax=Delitschia confertaspora ATCC 74209 TaxID=1513339 RepID=A0A9P4MSN6_9PLEO|nr:GPI-anchored wall transfer protein 1 [Delitschia confertaspora ATCC 74209]